MRSRCRRFFSCFGSVTGMKQMPTGESTDGPMTTSRPRSDSTRQPRTCAQNRARPGRSCASTTMWCRLSGIPAVSTGRPTHRRCAPAQAPRWLASARAQDGDRSRRRVDDRDRARVPAAAGGRARGHRQPPGAGRPAVRRACGRGAVRPRGGAAGRAAHHRPGPGARAGPRRRAAAHRGGGDVARRQRAARSGRAGWRDPAAHGVHGHRLGAGRAAARRRRRGADRHPASAVSRPGAPCCPRTST